MATALVKSGDAPFFSFANCQRWDIATDNKYIVGNGSSADEYYSAAVFFLQVLPDNPGNKPREFDS